MKGYWYIVAISVGASALTVIHNNYFYIIGFFLWLFYLFYNERVGKLPLIVSLSFFLFFSIYLPSKTSQSEFTVSSNLNYFIGKITSPLKITDQKLEIILENNDHEKLLVLYFFNDEQTKIEKIRHSAFKYGATCKATGDIQLPDESRNPGQFDYRDYLLSKGITHQMVIHSLDDLLCKGSSPLHQLYSLRDHIIYYVELKLSTATGSWLNALIFGNDTKINDETIEVFQRWGISHILAISGLHVGLIIGLVYFLLVKLNIMTKEKAQWLMICFLPLYAILAGGKPSVWRASFMVLLYIVFTKIKLKFSVMDTLSIVFLVILFFDKYMIYHIGFQFSFIVTFGLILSRQVIVRTKSNVFRLLHISFISQMIILPLQINYFFTFQPLSILLNVLVVPYFSMFVIPYMFLLLLLLPLPSFFISSLDHLFVNIHHLFLMFIDWIDQFVTSTFVIGDFPLLFVVIYYGLFFMMMINFQKNKFKKSFKYGCLTVGLIIGIGLRPYLSPNGTVTMLDIGQGDAFIIELPYRQGVFLIDAGARFSFNDFQVSDRVYRQIIKPYLYSRGIQGIDAVFLSHKDIDHMGSFQYIIEDFHVSRLYISDYYELTEEEKNILHKNNILVKKVKAPERIHVKNQSFYVLAPFKDENDKNENSLVLYSKFGGKSWLFTGDIGKNLERQISDKYDIRVDVLKVAHHGSNTSTDENFLKSIEPMFALIPVGVNNSYGHPTREVIEQLEGHEIIIFRTDEDGAVQYRYRNNVGTFFKFLP